MGCDIQLFTKGFINRHPKDEKKWINIDHWYRQDGWAEYMVNENQGFNYTNLISNNRDYHLFYLLAGVRGDDEKNSYLPISKPKGIPNDMDSLIKKYYEEYFEINFYFDNVDCHSASFLTLKELKDSGYGSIMHIKGWVYEGEYYKSMEKIICGEKYQLSFVDVKYKDNVYGEMILAEWEGYLNLNLTSIIEKMEALKIERNIESDEDIRIVFWFDN